MHSRAISWAAVLVGHRASDFGVHLLVVDSIGCDSSPLSPWASSRESEWLSHCEAVLVQQITGGTPDFYAPVSTVHGLLTVGAIALRLVRPDPQPRGFAERISPIPTMDDDAVIRRADAGVQDDRSRGHRIPRGAAPESLTRKAPAELYGHQLSGGSRRRVSVGVGSARQPGCCGRRSARACGRPEQRRALTGQGRPPSPAHDLPPERWSMDGAATTATPLHLRK